jgi:hypothetical protein
MAERAAQILIHNADDEASLQGAEIIPATIEIRESTGPVPAGARQPRALVQGPPE